MAARAIVLLLVLVAATAACAAASDHQQVEPTGGGIRQLRGGAGRKVGGRTEVRDVEGDREVQELGRFSVEEHNRRRRDCCGRDVRLEFGRVVAAQRQVVSGLKYYLRVVAAEEGAAKNGAGGEPRVFDAVVVVKPWLESRTLLTFAPAVGSPNDS
ncbi:hypothetical protein E2562_007565 [Oryza meyeriana var. granulata]|uniref:Cystatin domain-containing protein n=1 Tax=Oryza meyeriana var. granulata TaxID=110450 RepID=A0A6G1DVQ3_9ORYZ|nr:hypothetical protein E2562_007565 [Oryza meyeriana var. granulata]